MVFPNKQVWKTHIKIRIQIHNPIIVNLENESKMAWGKSTDRWITNVYRETKRQEAKGSVRESRLWADTRTWLPLSLPISRPWHTMGEAPHHPPVVWVKSATAKAPPFWGISQWLSGLDSASGPWVANLCSSKWLSMIGVGSWRLRTSCTTSSSVFTFRSSRYALCRPGVANHAASGTGSLCGMGQAP